MLTDGRTDGRTDDGRKVITIAHPEQSLGELKNQRHGWTHGRTDTRTDGKTVYPQQTKFAGGITTKQQTVRLTPGPPP